MSLRYRVANGVGRVGEERVTLHELARRLDVTMQVKPMCAYHRLLRGWEPRAALTTPSRRPTRRT